MASAFISWMSTWTDTHTLKQIRGCKDFQADEKKKRKSHKDQMSLKTLLALLQ